MQFFPKYGEKGHKGQIMEVWDPKDKKTVFSQIKEAIEACGRGLKVTRYIIYPGVLFIFLFLLFGLLPGCTSMKWPWEKEIPMIDDDPTIVVRETDNTANTIACIKLKPECIYD